MSTDGEIRRSKRKGKSTKGTRNMNPGHYSYR